MGGERGGELEIRDTGRLHYRMNRGVASILVLNLLKNAILHGKKESRVTVEILRDTLRISNSGREQALEKERLHSRFQNSGLSSASNGLGLAISRAIADRFDIELSYKFTGVHEFSLHLQRK